MTPIHTDIYVHVLVLNGDIRVSSSLEMFDFKKNFPLQNVHFPLPILLSCVLHRSTTLTCSSKSLEFVFERGCCVVLDTKIIHVHVTRMLLRVSADISYMTG